jgi:ureidoglycolate dehydrogenase (NAD+)
MDRVIRELRESKRMEGVDRIYLPGEIEHCRIRERLENGIPLAPIVVSNLRQLAAELNLSDRLE